MFNEKFRDAGTPPDFLLRFWRSTRTILSNSELTQLSHAKPGRSCLHVKLADRIPGDKKSEVLFPWNLVLQFLIIYFSHLNPENKSLKK